MIRIQDETFNAEEITAEMVNSRVGAVVSFTGVVRGESGDREVLRMDVQDYEGLALERLEKLRKKVVERFEVEDVAIVQRRGVLSVGEPIVFIAVAAAHRGPAFQACEYAIDHLKREVPIWKKEYTPDGEHWVKGEGCDL